MTKRKKQNIKKTRKQKKDELRKGAHIATVAKVEPWENTERRRRLLQEEEM